MELIKRYLKIIKIILLRFWPIIVRFLIIGIFTILLASTLFYIVEKPKDPDITLWSAIWSAFFTMVSADFVEAKPVTFLGKIIVTFLIFFGIAFVSAITATFATVMVINKMKEGKGMKTLRLKNHLVICGWNNKARSIVEEIINLMGDNTKPIVIIADLDENPMLDVEYKEIYFVKGNPSNDNALIRAGIKNADTAVVISDTSGGKKYDDADARTILTVLTIETLNSAVYSCAEILDSSNIKHLEYANVDEFIISGDFTTKMIASAALSHGISEVISQLITAGEGNEIYRCPMPDELVGKRFDASFVFLREKFRAIPLGVIREGKPLLNPETDFTFAKGDDLVVIAYSMPEMKKCLKRTKKK
ncbi:MAG: potassium channel family protein [bacterium]